MTDIIIIGAGPAGLTAAIYALRAGRSVLIFEAKIVNTPDIENYPGLKHVSGFEYATTLYEQATGFGAEIKNEAVVSIEDKGEIKEVRTDSDTYSAKAVIIATGAKNRHMGIDREEELIGKGISYCATCDGAFSEERMWRWQAAEILHCPMPFSFQITAARFISSTEGMNSGGAGQRRKRSGKKRISGWYLIPPWKSL